ncbi:sulfurtransferase [Solihabitans fulvus]|uniref:thiosulfate sulfurtransferase n=1 Tax=Solihabitans fulvus TaxID=1892852 RepID=A0A5B2WU37_9PSEU|nr:sulfurtransferase [Solihabitans fulvus]KAA2253939.1 sulfurtransferase [Solihabitans fulvus]
MDRTDLLVDADWVTAHADDPNVVLVEVMDQNGARDRGRIAGAVRIEWTTELQDPVCRDFLDQAAFEKLLSAKGIGNDHTVVLYSGNHNWWAASLYWYLKVYGHNDVRLLDGGRAKWELDSRPLVEEEPVRQATSYVAAPRDLTTRATRDDVLSAIGTRNLLDVRSVPEYTGELVAPAGVPQDPSLKRGHVPSARNIPWEKATNQDETFLPNDELAKVYADVDFDRETIVYCRMGWRSSHTWFVLHELLGRRGIANYDGAWVEYGALVAAPIAKGNEA